MIWREGVDRDCFFFFFNDTATTEIYTLSLHDALPILRMPVTSFFSHGFEMRPAYSSNCAYSFPTSALVCGKKSQRSEEHTSELQSQSNLVCRLLLEKKKKLQPPYGVQHITL